MVTGYFWHQYRVKGVEPYTLEFHYNITAHKVTIIGANMMRASGRYVGWWDARQMPLILLREVRAAIRLECAEANWGEDER